ncbi:hypothetical protein BDQ17DRAFT_1360265 [Cyathus striatus]|nr:hypothetical protein BDQ17DRAFT_1360265 [Cyathus striatus]
MNGDPQSSGIRLQQLSASWCKKLCPARTPMIYRKDGVRGLDRVEYEMFGPGRQLLLFRYAPLPCLGIRGWVLRTGLLDGATFVLTISSMNTGMNGRGILALSLSFCFPTLLYTMTITTHYDLSLPAATATAFHDPPWPPRPSSPFLRDLTARNHQYRTEVYTQDLYNSLGKLLPQHSIDP